MQNFSSIFFCLCPRVKFRFSICSGDLTRFFKFKMETFLSEELSYWLTQDSFILKLIKD